MLPDPFERAALVQQAGVEMTIAANLATGKEAKEAYAVVEVDEHDVLLSLYDI